MTDLRAPSQSQFTRAQHVAAATAMSLLTLTFLGYTAVRATNVTRDLGKTLLRTPVKTATGTGTWGTVFKTDKPILAALKCAAASPCSAWFNTAVQSRMNDTTTVIPIMLLFTSTMLLWRKVPSRLVRKDPGQGAWAGLNDHAIHDILSLKTKDRTVLEEIKKWDRLSPRSLYLGHMVPWTEHDGFAWTKPHVATLREWKRHEHVIVTGAPGSGKTRGVFRQNIAKDAIDGRVAIVFDLKWPQTDSGFRDLSVFWRNAGRPVYVFAPFSPNSMRIPLLDGIDDMSDALNLARAIIPPPENKEETGAFYKDTERRALAAMILAIAQSPTPTMRELHRLGHMNVQEFESWYKRQQNPEIRQALKALFDLKVEQISATLAGVINKLSIFYNPNVSRATTAGDNPAEIIDYEKLAQEGGLLLIGIETQNIQEGDGAILIQLIKRRLDRALLDIAARTPSGRMPRTVTYYLDELPGLGRLPYLMGNLAQLRSKAITMMLGVQNNDQGSLVYSKEYWKALSTNNLGTRVEFIQGTSKEEAKALSEEIGMQTVYQSTASTSGHRIFSTPWASDARKTEGLKVTKEPLLSPEEIKRFPPDLAVVFAKGQNPLLVATPALDSPHITIRTPTGRRVRVRNQLYPMWKKYMGEVKDIPGECDRLVASLLIQQEAGKVETVKAAPDYWQDWLGALLHGGAMARIQRTDDKLKIMIRRDTLPEKLQNSRDIDYFIGCGWLNVSQNEEELTILQDGLDVAGKVLTASLRDFLVRGPALYWARKNADLVRGYPGARQDASLASYTPETLNVPPEAAEEMYGLIPDLPRITEGGKTYLQIPLSDPRALSEAIDRATNRDSNQDPFRNKDKGKPKDRKEKPEPAPSAAQAPAPTADERTSAPQDQTQDPAGTVEDLSDTTAPPITPAAAVSGTQIATEPISENEASSPDAVQKNINIGDFI